MTGKGGLLDSGSKSRTAILCEALTILNVQPECFSLAEKITKEAVIRILCTAMKWAEHSGRRRIAVSDIENALVLHSRKNLAIPLVLGHGIGRVNAAAQDLVPLGRIGREHVFARPNRESDVNELIQLSPSKLPIDIRLKGYFIVCDGRLTETPYNFNKTWHFDDDDEDDDEDEGDEEMRNKPAQTADAVDAGAQAEERRRRRRPLDEKRKTPRGFRRAKPASAKRMYQESIKHAKTEQIVGMKAPVPELLTVEQQLFLKDVITVCMGQDDKKRSEALQALETDAGLQVLLPNLTQMVCKGIAANISQRCLSLTIYAARIIRSICLNKALDMRMMVHEILPALISCMVGRNICLRPESDNHWALRDYAARIVLILLKEHAPTATECRMRVFNYVLKVFKDETSSAPMVYGTLLILVEYVPLEKVSHLMSLFNEMKYRQQSIAADMHSRGNQLLLAESQKLFQSLVMAEQGNATVIGKKLAQEEEWLNSFKANVDKSSQISVGIEKLVEKFDNRLQSLEKNVLPIHIANGQLQKKQNNIQRLINTIDATLQFYGKTSNIENSIRDTNPLNDLHVYLGNMECLQQAINFFEGHPSYASQTENMKMTLDYGFTVLEKAYRTNLQNNVVDVDPLLFVKSYNNHELKDSKLSSIKTVKDEESTIKLGTWLLEQKRVQFLSHYSDIRGNFILKSIGLVAQCHKTQLANAAQRTKNVARKSTGRVEKGEKKDSDSGDVDGCLLTCGSLLVLLEIEEKIMVKAIPDISRRAQVFRELVSRPLAHVISQTLRVVQEKDAGIMSLLPLLHFFSQNQARFYNLATNSTADINFEQLMRTMQVKCSAYITELVEGLNDDSNKFVPPDGNVHPTTASTLNFLSSLTVHRVTVTQQVLAMKAPQENASLMLPKLFARALSALGSMLKKKSSYYDDPTLSNVFLLNNYNYIAKTLADEEDGLLPVISEQNTNILSFYQTEIANCIRKYMQSWSGVVSSLQNVPRIGEDKLLAKESMTNFAREFELLLTQQVDYCVSDIKLSSEIQKRVMQQVWPHYSTLLDVCLRLHVFPQGLKFTESTFKMSIDNLFSSASVR